MDTPAAMGVGGSWSPLEDAGGGRRILLSISAPPAEPAEVPICEVGGLDRTVLWPHWSEHTRAPFDIQAWAGHSGSISHGPGGVVSKASPGPRWKCLGCPALPPHPSRLSAAQLLTQGPCLAPTTPGHHCRGPFPPEASPSQERLRAGVSERVGAGRVDSKRLLPRGQTPRCVTDLHHQDAGEGAHADSSPLPAQVLTTSPRRRLGNHLMKRVIWGVFSINQKKCTLK